MKNLIICGEPTKVYNFDELIVGNEYYPFLGLFSTGYENFYKNGLELFVFTDKVVDIDDRTGQFITEDGKRMTYGNIDYKLFEYSWNTSTIKNILKMQSILFLGKVESSFDMAQYRFLTKDCFSFFIVMKENKLIKFPARKNLEPIRNWQGFLDASNPNTIDELQKELNHYQAINGKILHQNKMFYKDFDIAMDLRKKIEKVKKLRNYQNSEKGKEYDEMFNSLREKYTGGEK